ncbi:MAG: hypothetical protein Tsb009_04380 [Planctomycetaceae bacterium]
MMVTMTGMDSKGLRRVRLPLIAGGIFFILLGVFCFAKILNAPAQNLRDQLGHAFFMLFLWSGNGLWIIYLSQWSDETKQDNTNDD